LFTLIAGLLALALANQIASPIAAMADQFSRISASGDLSLRVQESENNEIGDMAKSFNAMQERVEQLHGRVVQAEERMRKELQMASTVQEMLFQQAMPHNRACDVAAYTSTLVETSGDWYAVFDDPEAKRTVFIIADATGHGASAALLTAITHGFFQTMWTARQGSDTALARIPPAQLLSMLNQVVLNSAHGTITATVFIGVLHHGTRKMVYASAGHIPPILTRWVSNEMKANILSCNPSSSIGSADKPVYEDYTVDLPADSLLLIYTDGLTEIENPQGMQWGVRKLISVLRGCQTDTVEAVRQKVLDSVMGFARGKELQDDVTYLTIRVL
jgi:sigma-B regulation protein RsbU (phosphoserine phosphatase)